MGINNLPFKTNSVQRYVVEKPVTVDVCMQRIVQIESYLDDLEADEDTDNSAQFQQASAELDDWIMVKQFLAN